MPGQTINDIANALGLSKASVSRAISGKGRLSAQTRARVLAYIDEQGYRPNAIAQSLASERTYNLAFVVPDEQELLETPFFYKCLTGMSVQAMQHACDVMVVPMPDDSLEPLRRVVGHRKVDGLVLSRNAEDDPAIAYLKEAAIPFVLIGSSADENVNQIDHDHTSACHDFTAQILEMHPGEAGLLAGRKRHVVNQQRYEGFAGAVSGDVRVVWDCVTEEAVLQAFAQLYGQGVRRFFCTDDVICLRLVRQLKEAQAQSPDIYVASFYDSEILRNVAPQVPAIRFDAKALGNAACELLIQRISGVKVEKHSLQNYSFVVNSRV